MDRMQLAVIDGKGTAWFCMSLGSRTVFLLKRLSVELADGREIHPSGGRCSVRWEGNSSLIETTLDDGTILLQKATATLDGIEYEVTIAHEQGINVRSFTAEWTTSATENAEFISVPYDNDDWVRYLRGSFGSCRESYDVGFTLEQDGCFAVGSLRHDSWKTAVTTSQDSLSVICGYTSSLTRDSLPHGTICGTSVTSDKILFLWADSYEKAFEGFAKHCRQYRQMLEWRGEIPFGWNSFSAFPNNVDLQKFQVASDYFADEKFTKRFFKDRTYINFDYAVALTDDELRQAVEHCQSNGQLAGFYSAPFVTWDSPERLSEPVDDTSKMVLSDILLRDDKGAPLPSVDNLLSLDPTHPETLRRAQRHIERHIKAGFHYIKIDFLGHGAREGCFWNKDIRTGRQAYLYAMNYIKRWTADRGLFVSASISPIFPYGYAHARRMCCDCFGTIGDSEYAMNSFAWGYPLEKNIYALNDPDHTVLLSSFKHSDTSEQEAQTRFVASVVAGGVMMLSDDYSNPEVRRRANKLLGNNSLLELIAGKKRFTPLTMPQHDKGADCFICQQSGYSYLAVLNFANTPATRQLRLSQLGVEATTASFLLEDYKVSINDELIVVLKPESSTIIRLE